MSLRPHRLQHARLPCPSPTLRAYSNSCHQVGDAIQPSHPLSPSSAFSLSQHRGFFQWVSSSHQVAKVLELQLQLSVLPMNIQGLFPLGLTGLISLQSEGLSNTIVQKRQFFSTHSNWNKLDTEKQILNDLICETLKKANSLKKKSNFWLPMVAGRGMKNWRKVVKRCDLPV